MPIDNELHFLDLDAGTIYDAVITSLETSVGEPLYPGDERRIYGEAIVALMVSLYNKMDDVARQKMLQYARGEVLDALGERTDTPRLQPQKSTVQMRFSLARPINQNVIIPQGTRVTADSTRYFSTDTIGVIQAGQTSITLQASALEGGEDYNGYAVGAINTLVDLIPYVSTVSNLDMSHGGDDGEPYDQEGDDRYRERIRLSVGKWSTAGPAEAYEYYALAADPDILAAKATTPAATEVEVIILMKDGQDPDEDTLKRVEAAVTDPKIRPMTDLVTVKAATAVTYDIEFTYYTTKAQEAEVVNNIEGPGGAIDRYNRWQTAQMGRDINPDQLRRLVLSPGEGLTGADRLEVVSPVFQEVEDTQVAKFSGTLKVSHKISSD